MSDGAQHDDELVSAYLDGEATADERKRVESDPRLRARVDRLRSVAQAVGSPVRPLAEAERQTLVDGALVAADRPEPTTAPSAPAPPRPIPRARRSIPQPAVAAAIAVLLLLGFGLLIAGIDGGRGDSDDTAAGGGEGAGRASTTTATADQEAAEDARPGATPGRTIDVGTYASDNDLRDALAANDLARLDSTDEPLPQEEGENLEGGAPPAAAPGDPPRCEPTVRAQLPSPGPVQETGVATVAGQPRFVFSHRIAGDDGEPVTLVSVVEPVDCRILFAVQR